MAKVGIITFLHNENCGSSLQAWALQESLRGLGHDPLGLDYVPDRAEQIRNLLSSGNHPGVVLDSLKRKHGRGERNTEGFDRFRREKLVLSAPCRNRQELQDAAAACEALICGSDQVWSPEWLNPVYFLNFAQDQKRISYAASLGLQVLPPMRKARIMQKLIRPFDAISVREAEGQGIIRELLPERDVAVMPDPVLLLSRQRWLDLAGNQPKKRFLVAYFLKDEAAHWDRAESMAKENRLTLVPLAVTPGGRSRSHAIPNPDPVQWLQTLTQAQAVITDSFHGAAMAAILGLPLVICRRWKDGDPASKNSRIDHLMRLVGWTQDDQCLPGEAVEASLAREQARGLNWLQEALAGTMPAERQALPGEAT